MIGDTHDYRTWRIQIYVDWHEKGYSGASSIKAWTSQTTPRPETFPFIGDYLYLPKKNAADSYSRDSFYKININDASDITTIAIPEELKKELTKASHRKYTTGFMFSDGNPTQNYESSIQEQNSKFMAIRSNKKWDVLVL